MRVMCMSNLDVIYCWEIKKGRTAESDYYVHVVVHVGIVIHPRGWGQESVFLFELMAS